ncbi:MAG: 16S rRNA (uracil(1498)-N(3))-methyltransferase [Oscillospiraceae bacterium]|nr:16S rRNA (uracil(1498)-N(3))-methyltransferase [Oscillospiraceae bacterium]
MDSIDIRFPRFFIDAGNGLKAGDTVMLGGDDAKHICTVLRMKAGEKALLCNGSGLEYPAEIIRAEKNHAEFKVMAVRENDSEPKVYLRLFQCVPKGDKLDYIVQKATELGALEIIPVISKRCVSRPISDKKISRLQKITEAAAKQSGRGKIPLVHEFTSFSDALKLHKKENTGIIFYENGGERVNTIFEKRSDVGLEDFAVDVFIGSEGGFEPMEIEAAAAAGFIPASLGKRILRTETAPVAALAVIMNLTGEI